MADVNVQIKQRNGEIWNNLYPVTKAPLVITDSTHRFVTDDEKTAWNGKQDALGYTPENGANKNQANGYAGLGSDGKLIDSQIPKIALSDTYVNASESEMLALNAEIGDVCVRTDISQTYILKATPASILANWELLRTPASPVQSINGMTGVVTLTKSDLGLANGVNITVNASEPSAPVNNDLWLSIV